MKEILFRGKRIDNGEWIYGVAFPHDNEQCTMLYQHPMDGSLIGKEVVLKTIGQYTDFTDENDTKIFEGDICHFYGGDYYSGHWEANHVCEIKICHECLRYIENAEHVEVIGNIYDNPELLNSV